MGIGDKIDNAKDQLVGKAKGAAGDATDNEDLQAEGQVQETKGDAKQSVEKAKDVLS